MKRSALVQKYTDILKMYGYVSTEFMPTESLAEVLLGIAENNGMLPPDTFIAVSDGQATHVKNIDGKYQGMARTNVWEPEND